jgi:hypothetical protein
MSGEHSSPAEAPARDRLGSTRVHAVLRGEGVFLETEPGRSRIPGHHQSRTAHNVLSDHCDRHAGPASSDRSWSDRPGESPAGPGVAQDVSYHPRLESGIVARPTDVVSRPEGVLIRSGFTRSRPSDHASIPGIREEDRNGANRSGSEMDRRRSRVMPGRGEIAGYGPHYRVTLTALWPPPSLPRSGTSASPGGRNFLFDPDSDGISHPNKSRDERVRQRPSR